MHLFPFRTGTEGGSVPNAPVPGILSSPRINSLLIMKNLNDELRYRLLKKLEQNPHMTQRELANEMGLSLGKVNYCVKALVEQGWVKMGNFRRHNSKLDYVYLLTPKGIEEKAKVTIAFLKIKQAEYDRLKGELRLLRDEAAEITTDRVMRETE